MLPTVFGENLFDDFFDDSFGMMNARSPLYGKHARNLMKTDIRETDTNYELAIDLPGFKKEDITLELQNGLSPIVLTPADNKYDFAYMVLPVRIKNG